MPGWQWLIMMPPPNPSNAGAPLAPRGHFDLSRCLLVAGACTSQAATTGRATAVPNIMPCDSVRLSSFSTLMGSAAAAAAFQDDVLQFSPFSLHVADHFYLLLPAVLTLILQKNVNA